MPHAMPRIAEKAWLPVVTGGGSVIGRQGVVEGLLLHQVQMLTLAQRQVAQNLLIEVQVRTIGVRISDQQLQTAEVLLIHVRRLQVSQPTRVRLLHGLILLQEVQVVHHRRAGVILLQVEATRPLAAVVRLLLAHILHLREVVVAHHHLHVEEVRLPHVAQDNDLETVCFNRTCGIVFS